MRWESLGVSLQLNIHTPDGDYQTGSQVLAIYAE